MKEFKILLWTAVSLGRAWAMIGCMLQSARAFRSGDLSSGLYLATLALLLFPAWGWQLMGHGRDEKP